MIIGENRSFDHVFATYSPRTERQFPICSPKASSTPTEPRTQLFAVCAVQRRGQNHGRRHSPSARRKRLSIPTFPPSSPAVRPPLHSQLAVAREIEPGQLAPGSYHDLTIGGTGLEAYAVPDTRIPNVLDLPEGAFPAYRPAHLQRLCQQPGAPLLSDVAADGLQRRSGDQRQSQRLL